MSTETILPESTSLSTYCHLAIRMVTTFGIITPHKVSNFTEIQKYVKQGKIENYFNIRNWNTNFNINSISLIGLFHLRSGTNRSSGRRLTQTQRPPADNRHSLIHEIE